MFGLFLEWQAAYLAPEVNWASMQCFHSWWTWLTAPEGYDHLHWLSVDLHLSPLVGTPIGDFQRWRPHASNFPHSTRKSTFRTFSFSTPFWPVYWLAWFFTLLRFFLLLCIRSPIFPHAHCLKITYKCLIEFLNYQFWHFSSILTFLMNFCLALINKYH